MKRPRVLRALVYGFGPYPPYRDNVTETAVRALPRAPGLRTRVFDVRFDRRMFERAFSAARPQVIVGLGQHPRARKLRLERRARAPGAPRGGPRRARFATLDLPRTRDTTVAYDAGDYVCNFSMWVALGWARRHGACFAFIHVPRTCPLPVLASYLRRCLRNLGGAAT
jgi:pyrrolidone-carboxylate peptidase